MGNAASDIKNVKVSHIKAIDTQGSIVIYIEGRRERKVAALKGTPMYELGKRLADISDCDEYISQEVVRVAQPASRFYFEGKYSEHMKELMEDEEEHRKEKGDLATRDDVEPIGETLEEPSITADVLDPEAGVQIEEEEEEEGGVATEEEEEEDFPQFTDQDLEHVKAAERAAHQHFVCRAVSQWPVVTMKPFINEFFSRFVDINSPYTIFSEDVYTVFRLWMNTGVSQSSLFDAIVQFLQDKDRLGPMWSMDTLEAHLMCHMYNEYERLFPELESSKIIAQWGDKHADDESRGRYADRAYRSLKKSEKIIRTRETQRLWMYYEEKNSLLRQIYQRKGRNDYQFHNPIPSITLAPDIKDKTIASTPKVETSYRRRDITEEQRVMRDVLETIATVTAKRVECWEKFMEPVRKLMVEVRDICNQVALNQIRQEHPEEIVDYDTSYLKFRAGRVVQDVPPPSTPDVMHQMKTLYTHESGSEMDEMVPSSANEHVAYDPEIPHIPLDQLGRLMTYLDLSERSLLHAFKVDDPQMREDVHHPDYEAYGEGSDYAQSKIPDDV
jgi:effector-binding domain-containing protein